MGLIGISTVPKALELATGQLRTASAEIGTAHVVARMAAAAEAAGSHELADVHLAEATRAFASGLENARGGAGILARVETATGSYVFPNVEAHTRATIHQIEEDLASGSFGLDGLSFNHNPGDRLGRVGKYIPQVEIANLLTEAEQMTPYVQAKYAATAVL